MTATPSTPPSPTSVPDVDPEVAESLRAVAGAVPVPLPDHAAFGGRVRRERRRRTTGRVLAGTAVAAALATAAVNAPDLLDDGSARVPAAARTDLLWPDAGSVSVLLDGRLQVVGEGGAVHDTGVVAAELVGRTEAGEVVLDEQGRLLAVAQDGTTSRLVEPAVRAAFLDPTGVTYQTVDGRIRWRGTDVPSDSAQTSGPRLLAAGERAWVGAEDGQVFVSDRDGRHELPLGSDGTSPLPRQVEVAGSTVAVHDAGYQFFDTDGTRRLGELGGRTGALSPAGTTYAAAPDRQELGQGMRPGVFVADTTTGQQTRLSGPPSTGAAVDLAWSGPDRFLVVLDTAGTRTLWECATPAMTCGRRVTDPGGTLSL